MADVTPWWSVALNWIPFCLILLAMGFAAYKGSEGSLKPLWMRLSIVLGIALLFGIMASTNTTITEGGDHLRDPGEVVDVIENRDPWGSFARATITLSVVFSLGVLLEAWRRRA